DFVPDTRDEHRAPARPRPELAYSDPAGAFFVLLPLAVPVELDLDAAVLVRVDLLSLRPHHDGGLRAADRRPRSGPARSVLGFHGDTSEIVRVRRPFRLTGGGHAGMIPALPGAVAERRQQVVLVVQVLDVTVFQS